MDLNVCRKVKRRDGDVMVVWGRGGLMRKGHLEGRGREGVGRGKEEKRGGEERRGVGQNLFMT